MQSSSERSERGLRVGSLPDLWPVTSVVGAFVQISSNWTAHPGADERLWTGCSGRPPVHCQTVQIPLPGRRATWHIPLFGLLKFHSVSLCGRLYPLPRRSTFRFRNVLHLVEARNRVAHVRGVLQRLLALLGKSELGCRYPITSWFGQLCHCFPPSGASPCARTARDFLPRITAFPVPAAWCG